ncbi:MAG TPA: Flp pilus assembly protein CpaB [Stellaceae bacterium]
MMLAAAAFYGVFGTATPKPQAVAAAPPPPPPARPMAVVAAKPIPTGTLIAFEDLRFAAVEPDQQTGGDFMRQPAPDAKDQAAADHRVFSDIAGGVSRVRFDEGVPITRGAMVKPGDSGFLAAVLRPGMRAVTLAVNVITGDAGLLFPGDHVDVLLTQIFVGHETDPGNRSVAETIATNLRVIAVDQRLQAGAVPQKDSHPAQSVTLEVTALQAEQIGVAAKMGEMGLAIRGIQAKATGDEGPKPPAMWAKDLSPAAAEILSVNNNRPPPPGQKIAPGANNGDGKPQLRVIRGDKVETVVLP